MYPYRVFGSIFVNGNIFSSTKCMNYKDTIILMGHTRDLITNQFIPAIKKALNIRGLQVSDYMTAPFTKPNENQVCEIEKLMNELNIC